MALLLRSVRTTRMGRDAEPLLLQSEGRAVAGVGVDRSDPARYLASLYVRMGAAQRVVGCSGLRPLSRRAAPGSDRGRRAR